MGRYVYDFAQGNREMRDLLGGKGANLAEMTRLGLPVPPGFTITTEACRSYLRDGVEPPGLRAEVDDHLAALERTMGRRLGQPDDPLLVSVRSGAKFSMPGMMDTVLNVGLTDESVLGLAKQSGSSRFAWDSYRRLLEMFGRTVLGVPAERFAGPAGSAGAGRSHELGEAESRAVVDAHLRAIREHTGREFPQHPREQLDLAVRAVFASWNGERARVFRRAERIPDDLGTAVSIVAMVFGNLGEDSGTGVAFTRDPATGEPGRRGADGRRRAVYGDYLPDAQGEDVVAGLRNTRPLADLASIDPVSYDGLTRVMDVLEEHYRDLCDIEFTIERGRLWILQTRVGRRTPAAAFRIAAQLADEGVIDDREALRRVGGDQLASLMFPRFDERGLPDPIARGTNASPGAAVGVAVFDAARAAERAAGGEAVILVRRETNPDDLAGMIAARGILTSRGGRTSHAAVVARGMGRSCVCGAEDVDVDLVARRFTTSTGAVVAEGEVISLDGGTGAVYAGERAVVPSVVVDYFEGTAATVGRDPLVNAVDRLMRTADRERRTGVRANADTPADAARARRFGASGIGLCRTEHMFLGDRRRLVERMILADSGGERRAALAALLGPQREDFVRILRAMDGLPVTVRLIDPPLHEFLPDLTDLAVAVATDEAAGREVDPADRGLLDALRRMRETNPMLGLRGVRLGLVMPDLVRLQARAIGEATARLRAAGGDPRPEIMVPLVGSVREFTAARRLVDAELAEVAAATGTALDDIRVGAMIEVPRAAVTAAEIAAAADFLSFGTNDLTQLTWGFSRDDVETSFFGRYLELGIFEVSPFESIDRDGVGALVRSAVVAARAAGAAGPGPDPGPVGEGVTLGVCGEHGGDPESVHFFHDVGVDYVSCSPFRVPVARLEAGRAALPGTEPRDSRTC